MYSLHQFYCWIPDFPYSLCCIHLFTSSSLQCRIVIVSITKSFQKIYITTAEIKAFNSRILRNFKSSSWLFSSRLRHLTFFLAWNQYLIFSLLPLLCNSMMPGLKDLNPHELAHRWMKDLGTLASLKLNITIKKDVI